MQGLLNIRISTNLILYINTLKNTYMIISLETKRAFNKTQHPFIFKVSDRSVIQGTYLNIIKTLYGKPIANIKQNGEKLKAFPLKSGRMQVPPLSLLSLSIQHRT